MFKNFYGVVTEVKDSEFNAQSIIAFFLNEADAKNYIQSLGDDDEDWTVLEFKGRVVE